MAQVNVDLSEYDMLRQSKDKAEKEVSELKEEVKQLKDNASNVVVRNRYYIPSIDYKAAANKLLQNLGQRGIEQLYDISYQLQRSAMNDPFGRVFISPDLVKNLGVIIERSIKDFLNLKASYIEDSVTTEIRGFDEFAETIKAKYELEYKSTMEEKKAQLEREIESYNVKHLDVDKAVEKAEEALKEKYEVKIKKLEEQNDKLKQNISELNIKLGEASKTSEEKLAEAMEKLRAAEAEVAKYSTPRKKLFGLF